MRMARRHFLRWNEEAACFYRTIFDIILLFYREHIKSIKYLQKSAAIYKNNFYLLQVIRKGRHTNIFIGIYTDARSSRPNRTGRSRTQPEPDG